MLKLKEWDKIVIGVKGKGIITYIFITETTFLRLKKSKNLNLNNDCTYIILNSTIYNDICKTKLYDKLPTNSYKEDEERVILEIVYSHNKFKTIKTGICNWIFKLNKLLF